MFDMSPSDRKTEGRTAYMLNMKISSAEECRELFLRIGGKEMFVPARFSLPIVGIYYVLEGHVALMGTSVEGEGHSFIHFRPGDVLNFFPVVADSCGIPWTSNSFRLFCESLDMRTKTPCRLILVEHDDFRKHMDEGPVKDLLLRSLTSNLQRALSQSLNNCMVTAPVRVCRMIVTSMSEKAPHILPRFLTHAEIAGHLSLHVMTVTKIFHALREQGILEKSGSTVQVKKPDLLQRIAYQEAQLIY